MLHRAHDAPRDISPVRVMADLSSVAQDVQRILTFQHLLNKVRDYMAHRERHVPTKNLDVSEGPLLSDTNTIERSHDRIREPVLAKRSACEILDRKLLKTVRG